VNALFADKYADDAMVVSRGSSKFAMSVNVLGGTPIILMFVAIEKVNVLIAPGHGVDCLTFFTTNAGA